MPTEVIEVVSLGKTQDGYLHRVRVYGSSVVASVHQYPGEEAETMAYHETELAPGTVCEMIVEDTIPKLVPADKS